ncbi:D-ribose transporter ATP-binding protein [Actibacterium mucosum KCTC 23349]|uniref:D-ribose transporter ATP-binding protein n=1 Tax=Actibacterium mucosum KCTC 23349 TaxID=1454373 RepID=A0A037ZF26_9RHOB|nr:D-ribose transporter ATP-binding protein [Actibacterium mucosum KCTC 23349]
MNDIVLQLTNIRKSYGAIHALKGVHFTLRRGEIHALAGENGAGKSTLMKIIDGIVQPDSGQIVLNGDARQFRSPLEAQRAGIGFVHQEIALCPQVSVAQNICMSRINTEGGFLVNYREVRQVARAAIEQLADIDVNTLVGDLSISNQQVVEIAKALTLDCQILILDEPTAALTDRETEALFAIMHRLKAQGMSIIFISHRMAEIFEHCDHVTVLRDGEYVMDTPVADTTPEDVVNALVGRQMTHLYPDKLTGDPTAGPVILRAEAVADEGRVRGVDLTLHKGEILGLAGLIGAGRSELVQTLCGLRRRTAGRVELNGAAIHPRDYADAIRSGLVYLSEDRKGEGVFLNMPIAQNVSALRLDKVTTPFGMLDRRAEMDQARTHGAELRLKAGSLRDDVSSLSGGNQQKVAIAKLLTANPAVMMLDEPTRGVDVGAKAEIHALLRDFAEQGVGIIVVSSELPEVIGLCDRVLVMAEGRISGELSGDQMTEENIMALASGLALTG